MTPLLMTLDLGFYLTLKGHPSYWRMAPVKKLTAKHDSVHKIVP